MFLVIFSILFLLPQENPYHSSIECRPHRPHSEVSTGKKPDDADNYLQASSISSMSAPIMQPSTDPHVYVKVRILFPSIKWVLCFSFELIS